MQPVHLHHNRGSPMLLVNRLQNRGIRADVALPSMPLDQVNRLQGSNNVHIPDIRAHHYILNREILPTHALNILDNHLSPVRHIALAPQIRQRRFRRAHNLLLLTQCV